MDQMIAEASDAYGEAKAKRESLSDDDLLIEAREAFDEAEEAEEENRRDGLDDLKFARLGEQWPDEARKKREAEGRPCLTINKMPAFTKQVVNDARQNRPSIKVRPADSVADPRTAEIMGGLIRNIEVTSNADVAYDTALASVCDSSGKPVMKEHVTPMPASSRRCAADSDWTRSRRFLMLDWRVGDPVSKPR